METKNYREKVLNMKNEILNEIRSLVQADTRHEFTETFYIHYLEGEFAVTNICHAVLVFKDLSVAFCVSDNPETPVDEETVLSGKDLLMCDVCSFIDILKRIKDDIRHRKLFRLLSLVRGNNGYMSFDGSFEFLCDDTEQNSENNLSHSALIGLEIDGNGNLLVRTMWKEDGECYDYNQDCICDAELDNILKFVEERSGKTFKITVAETLSRVYEVKATCYDNAVRKVKESIKDDPLGKPDSDGICIDMVPWK